MDFYLFSSSKFVYVFIITFEWYDNVSIPHHFHKLNFILNNSFFLSEILEPKETLFVAKIYISFISSTSQAYIFNLFFIKYLIWLFIISLEKIFRLIKKEVASLRTYSEISAVIKQMDAW